MGGRAERSVEGAEGAKAARRPQRWQYNIVICVLSGCVRCQEMLFTCFASDTERMAAGRCFGSGICSNGRVAQCRAEMVLNCVILVSVDR